MALCLEQLEDYPNAYAMFEQILSIDYYYKDCEKRAKELRARLAATSRPSGSGMHSMPQPPAQAQASLAPQRTSDSGSGKPKRYEIIEEIARGGMGIVFKARDSVLNRLVAFKILSENLKRNKTAVEYFLREARAAAALSHPNIVTVFDAGEQEGEYYMAMEYVEGETLKNLVTRQGPFPEKLVRYLAVHACRGLQYAHEREIVHRDIKSGNMMLTREKVLKIMDFGLAKFLTECQSQHTRAIGTPYYMSPEQIVGKQLDFRSDLYSLGVTVFEVATGRVPFYKGDLSYHHLHTPPPKAREINSALSEDINAVIEKLLQKNPDDRYQSAAHVIRALKGAAG